MRMRSASSAGLQFLLCSCIGFVLVATLLCPAASAQEAQSASSVQPLITQAIDESQVTVLRGNTHPLARPEFDLGTAPASLPMERMLLVLKRSPAQELALRKMLDDQQDKSSPNYHKWLTPGQFGKQFGPSDDDMQKITGWLQSHGFQVGTTKGRTVLEFSGSASQVQEAFHTTIHKYVVNGEQHWANAGDPAIPAALTGAVGGIHTLHNFLKKPMLQFSGEKAPAHYVRGQLPDVTFSNGQHGLGPQDYATIYNINPLYNGSPVINGSGSTIGIVARSNLYGNGGDVYSFGQIFNTNIFLDIYVNGPDPGDLGGGEEAEATLDASWAAAVAPGANIAFTVSASTNTTDGVDLSEVALIEGNGINVMTESFGTCEANLTSTEAQGISALAEQAAAQGITYMVSSGDAGAEGCDNPNFESQATGPVSVNALGSSPFHVAVGGTMFNENGQPSKYWRPAGQYITGSAISYIPENVWNESCPASQCGANANIWAAGGGASIFWPKPSWQPTSLQGMPNDNSRDVPDVSLTAAGHDPYLVCLEGSCIPNGQGQIFLYFVSGTSAASPSFAGVMALVDQKMGSITQTSAGYRQGQADYVLYKLAEAETFSQCNASSTSAPPASTCVFNDVTLGNDAVPGELNYGASGAPYPSGNGYDQATGLGSVNIANLVNNWNTVTFQASTTTIVSLTPSTITHGQPMTISVTVTGNGGTPTGSVSIVTSDQDSVEQSVGIFPLTSGSFSGQIPTLPAPGLPGFVSVIAKYGGDGTFGSSSSGPYGQITVNPEPSNTAITGTTLYLNGNYLYLTPISGSVSYGNMVYLRADVAGQSGLGTPGGTITFADANGDPPIPGNPYRLNSGGNAVTPQGFFTLPVGPYSIGANYSGDNSFNASSSAALAFTITQAATSSVVTANNTSVGSGSSVTLTANVATGTASTPSFGAAPGGTVSFYANGTLVGTAQPVTGTAGAASLLTGPFTPSSATASLVTTALPTGTDTITATYSGDANYAASTSPGITLTVSPDFSLPSSGFGTVTISSPGGSGSVNLTITPGTGFNAAVTFTCLTATLPRETQCTQANIAAGQTTGTMTVSSTAPHAQLRADRMALYLGWFAGGISLVGMCVTRGSRHKWLTGTLLGALLTVFTMLPACGGGSGGGGGNQDPGTPPGTYTVTVTGTSGSLSHNTTFTLVVQ